LPFTGNPNPACNGQAQVSMDCFNADGLYYTNGTFGITGGTVNHKITLVVGGNLTFSGNVQLTGAILPVDQQPSLGVIGGFTTANTIWINGNVTRVDAYLFSNGTINTCSNYAGSYTAACAPTLVVNGFLTSHSILFHRFGPNVALGGATPAEVVTLMPQLYLNPPILFGDLSSTNLTQSQGEKPPLQ
jgi:hypothetical protein